MQHLLRRGALIAALCGVVAVVAVPAATASASISLKGFSVSISGTAKGGTTSTLTATIKDEMLLVPVQSAALFVPSGLTVQSVTLPAGSHAKSLITPCPHSSAQCVELTNLGLFFFNKSFTFTMSVSAPAACSSSNLTWGASARPDALISLLLQLLGIGNLPLDTANSSLGTTAADSCGVSFVQEPTNTLVAPAQITPAVTAEVEDASSTPMAGVAVTMSLATNLSATLGGTLMQTTGMNGIATFNDLTVSQPNTGYELDASITGSSAISTPFDVNDSTATCTAGTSCNTQASTSGGSAQITGTGSGTLTESVNVPGQTLSCTEPTVPVAGIADDPNTYDFSSTGTVAKTVTINITDPKTLSTLISAYPFETGESSLDFPWGDSTGNDNDWDDALNAQNICFESSTSFEAVDPTTGAMSLTPNNTPTAGILPSCTAPPSYAPAFAFIPVPGSYPCHDRASDSVSPDMQGQTSGGYTVTLVAQIPPSWDPLMN